MKLRFSIALIMLLATTVVAQAQAPVSDDFSGGVLNSNLWTVVNPVGDGSVSVNGTQLVMSIPAGSEHHPWTSGNKSLRVMQPCTDTSFQVEAKFESEVTTQYQMQGIIAEVTPTQFLRVEFHHNGTAIKIFASVINGTSASTKIFSTITVVNPQFLRVTRSGSSWTIAYSGDGSTWTTAGSFTASLAVTQVGPFVGNTGTANPAHTALVDYFFNTASPITPEDGGSASIETTVNGSGTLTLNPNKPFYVVDEVVTMTATPSNLWAFDGWTGSQTGTVNPVNYVVAPTNDITANFVQLISGITVVSGPEQGSISFDTTTTATAIVKYGLTTAYELGSVQTASGQAALHHTGTLTNLTGGNTYNCRIEVTDINGRVAKSSNLTLVPQAGTGIVSDDFSNPTLNGDWEFVNPLGDGSYSLNGAHLILNVPAGVNHQAWTTGYTAPRVLQSISNVNFDVEAKFESSVNLRYQQQGIVIEATPTHFIRIEMYHDGAGVKLFGGILNGPNGSTKFIQSIPNTPKTWLRVNRTGNVFTVWYSGNGTSWTQAGSFSATLAVTKIGPYVANLEGPAHTAVVDYFFDTNAPIVPEDGGVSVMHITTAGNGTIQYSPSKPQYAEGEALTLTAVPATNWSFAGWTGDMTTLTNPLSLTVPATLDLTANFQQPTVTNLTVQPGTDHARVIWDLAAAGTCTLRYGINSVNEHVMQAAGGATQSNFNELLEGLQPETNYLYQITATDGNGGNYNTGVLSFTTFNTGIRSDDFSGPLNEEIWTFVDPQGDSSLTMNGTHAVISMPGGTSHDSYTNGAVSPRLVQSIPDADFDVVVKFESVIDTQYQIMGLLALQDVNNFLRFDFYATSSSVKIFAAAITNNSGKTYLNTTIPASVPYYLRVRREGDVWTMFWSTNGETYTQAVQFTKAMTINEIGPYAGNVNAQHTAWIDYFESASNPILSEDGSSRVITLQTNGSGTATKDPEMDVYAEGSEVTLTATPGNNWKFVNWSGDISSANNPQVITVNSDKIITANFSKLINNWVIDIDETQATLTIATVTPTTARVDYGTTSGYELGTVFSNTSKTVHTFVLTGLTPGGAQHHFEITATDVGGGIAKSGDLTFYSFSEASIISDDFHSSTLNTSLWTFVDPLGDATLTMSGTQAIISLPANTTHEIWNAGINSPRLMQATNDTDFEVEAKFDSALTNGFQMQGIAIEAAPGHVIRMEFYTNGNSIYAFGGVVNSGSVSTRFNVPITLQPPHFIRVNRTGNVFTLRYSSDGQTWLTAGTVTEAMAVTAVGPYIGNINAAHTGAIDYFFNTAAPISPEDNGEYSLVVNINGQGSVLRNPNLTTYSTGQQVELTALGSGSWTFNNWSGDLTGSTNPNTITIDGDTVIYANFISPTGSNTIFDIWYGTNQTFGVPGLGQIYVDILGTVTDPDGLAALSYSVNGGPSNPLSIGPDGRRLQGNGDFIAQIPYSDLLNGVNSVVITSTDQQANQSFETVTVNFNASGFVPENYSINWSQVNNLQEVAQVVDGKWTHDSTGLKNISVGYDRLVTIGDATWTDYEVTVPMTVHSYDPAGIGGINGFPGAGFIVRWTGHTNDPVVCPQPLCGWLPFGNVVWYRWDETGGVSSTFSPGNLKLQNQPNLQYNVTYLYKVRVETPQPGQPSVYSFKIWQQGTAEPGWMKTITAPTSKASGSVLLISHWTEVTFGNITVTGLNTTQPISQVDVVPASDGATISWVTDAQSETDLNYGLTSGYELGSVNEPTPKFTHEVTLTNLQPNTLYHFEVVASDGNGGTVSSGDLTFQTSSVIQPSDIDSDQFNDPTLNTSVWEVIDPQGGATVSMTGNYLSLAVPSGVDYDAWAPNNNALQVMQSVTNSDFEAIVKFDTQPTAKYTFQGLMVKQDNDTFLRFDFLGIGNSRTNLFVGEIDNGSATARYNKRVTFTGSAAYIRVTRTGDLWQVAYSSHGTSYTTVYSFSRPINMTQIGVTAGNGSPNPGYTALADYFVVTAN